MAAVLQTFGGGTTDFILDPANGAKPLPNTPYTVIDGATMLPATGLVDGSGAAVTQLKSDAYGQFAGGALLQGSTFWLEAVVSDGSTLRWGPLVSSTAVSNTLALAPQLDTIAASAAASAFSAKQAQAAAESALSGVNAPAAAAIDARLGGNATNLIATVAGKVAKGDLAISVLDYGAKGDGATDDAAAAQAAANAVAANGGGTLLFPGGKTYRLSAGVDLSSHMTVDFSGATLLKRGGDPDYYVFKAGSKGAVDGVTHLTIRGGNVRGSFTAGALSGASITLNKARHVLIENVTFTEAVVSGHAIDVGGCNGVEVRSCVFAGFNPQAGRYYVEAIQADFAYADGNAVDTGFPGSYDGEPTRNLLVRGCKFIPLTIGGTTYPAPNPIGSHARIQNTYLDNIRFQDNYVEGCKQTDDVTAATFDAYTRGWVHFSHAKNVRIERNTFVNTGSKACLVIGAQGFGTGVLLADTAKLNAPSSTITPCPIMDWVVAGNTFRGFNAAGTGEPLIYLSGHGTAPTLAYGLEVRGNYVEQSCPVVTDASNTGSTFVKVTYADDVKIVENRVREIRLMADVANCTAVDISGNRIGRTSWTTWEIATCTAVTVTRNKVGAHAGGLHTIACFDVVVSDNRMAFMSPATTSGFACHISLSSTESALVHHNHLSGTTTRGMQVYTNSRRVRIETNIVLGATTPVDLTSSTITDCTQSGTVSA